MAKTIVLNIKIDADDHDRLVWLARHVQRSKADTMRWLIRQATGGPKPAPIEESFSFVDPLAIIGDWEEWGTDVEEADR